MEQQSSNITTILAVYGAILSTVAIGWNIFREVTNRGRLRVTVTLAEIHSEAVGLLAKDKLWYKVTNVGRQPIWLTSIGGGLRSGQNFLLKVPVQFPIKLDPGQTFDDASVDAKEVQEHLSGPDQLTFLGAWDSLNKVHKVPRRRLTALLKRLQQKK